MIAQMVGDGRLDDVVTRPQWCLPAPNTTAGGGGSSVGGAHVPNWHRCEVISLNYYYLLVLLLVLRPHGVQLRAAQATSTRTTKEKKGA